MGYIYDSMKRRKFILLSVAAAGAAALPAGCAPGHAMPEMLSLLADKATLRQVGAAYLEQHPEEKNRLQSLLSTADVQNDFVKGNIVVIKGWVLSVTEARQCALLSL
jgi:ABC-type oligopeptide transport system substrate-binding subunit